MSQDTRITPYQKTKQLLNSEDVEQQFRKMLGSKAPGFIASVINTVFNDRNLKDADPSTVLSSAVKAAVLDLPVDPNLGFSYIIPYKNRKKEGNQWVTIKEAAFQLGYKGYIQLCLRTKQYDAINVTEIFQGEEVRIERLTGKIVLNGKKISDEVIGYAAYFRLKDGFEKYHYMTVEQIHDHAKKFSKSYGSDWSAWSTHFDAMAKKTVLKALISKYGIMSVQMLDAVKEDVEEDQPDNGRSLSFDDSETVDAEYREAMDEIDEQPESPDNIDDGEVEQPKPQPSPIAEAMVNADMADNIFNANAIIQLLELEGETKWTKAIEKKVKGYRGWRDIGADPPKAAGLIKKGEYPK